ncbi:hypothetical protein [Roseivirga pacifica]|nr:hypothetical protein [Roseivirga pacifica]
MKKYSVKNIKKELKQLAAKRNQSAIHHYAYSAKRFEMACANVK